MNSIESLQEWYAGECNGDWEHAWGIRIETLDNPGWSIDIDLSETAQADQSFSPVNTHRDDDNWITCKVVDAKFKGRCGPKNLDEMLQVFASWVHGDGKRDGPVHDYHIRYQDLDTANNRIVASDLFGALY